MGLDLITQRFIILGQFRAVSMQMSHLAMRLGSDIIDVLLPASFFQDIEATCDSVRYYGVACA